MFFSGVEEGLKPVAVATGNWGCGAFRGDPQLKSLIQLMAASLCNRDIVYFTFNDKKLCNEIQRVYNKLVEFDVSVGDLFDLLNAYGENTHVKNFRMTLFEFLMSSSLAAKPASENPTKRSKFDESQHRGKPSPEKPQNSYASALKGKGSHR